MAANSIENFSSVARERGIDASILKQAGRFLAAIYMSGYAVECGLKALLQKKGKRFPTSGREGHDLRSLWEAAGFKIDDVQGYRRLVIDVWTTNLRYEQFLRAGIDFEALYQGSIELSGYIQKRIRSSKK